MTFDSLRGYCILALYLAGSVTVVLGVISLIRAILAMGAGQSIRKWVLLAIVLCSAGTLLLATGIWGRKIVEERRWNQALDENYTFYIDGVQVNPDTVVQSDYKITYDDENKNVMMTRSNNIRRPLW